MIKAIFSQAIERGRRFRSADDGQIALLFGLMAVVLVTATGGGIDLMRAYNTRQKLSEVVTLTCQYASRPSVLKLARSDAVIPPGSKSYTETLNAYVDAALLAQQVAWTPTRTINPMPNGVADITLSVAVPTAFARVIQVNEIPVSATAHCYDSPATTPDPAYVTKEGFEARGTPTTTAGGWQTYGIDGKASSTPSSKASTTPVYTGSDNTAWYGTGYCLETDQVGNISGTVPEGRQSAELDCENGSGSAGNSAISTRVQLYANQNYELRYNYRSRVGYPNYDPAYLCGSAAADLSWANDTLSSGGPVANALRTNQINVYLDRTSETITPAPLHTTIDGTQQLAGSNLIDMCVYSGPWIERSVRIKVTMQGYYWLTFAADGQNDSYGGQIDDIRFCVGTCPDPLQDNFPPSWLAANNGGANKVLFRDSFDSPVYRQDPSISFNRTKGGNLVNSLGTSGAQSGWPGQAASGWATGPYNQVNVWLQDAYQGQQYLSMQGWNGFSTGTDTLNRLISRKFLLVPGYYNVSYNYISMIDFGATAGIYGTACTASPGSGALYSSYTRSLSGRPRYTSSAVSITQMTNVLGVFMSHGQLVSSLNPNTSSGTTSSNTIGGQASYTNPDGTVTTIPKAPPDKVNWAAYDATANNPLIDTCGYAAGYAWTPRSATIKVTKPGWYWLTFSAQGDDVTGTGNGPAIDDVKLTALGSPYMAATSNTTTIPVPAPQPDSRIYFDGFYIVADPFTPTAPLQ